MEPYNKINTIRINPNSTVICSYLSVWKWGNWTLLRDSDVIAITNLIRILGQNGQVHQFLFTYRQLLKTMVILVPLLGFTWIIRLFAVEEEGRVFAYLFVIANVFQVRWGYCCNSFCH